MKYKKGLLGPAKASLPICRELSMGNSSSDQIALNTDLGSAPDNERLRKYREIIVFFETAISQGKYQEGERLPSESQLVKQFGWSRPTISRAMREMQLAGLIERRAGSGSYVSKSPVALKPFVFGLLVPNFAEMEISEAICGQIAREAQSRGYDLLWTKLFADKEALVAERICEPYLRQRVAGVFFAPVELTQAKDVINQRIAAILEGAGIPIVLLDRDLFPFPARSKHDLVGIDNYAAGHMLAQHLLECGCKSIAYIAHPFSAATVQARSAGVVGALLAGGHLPSANWNQALDPLDLEQVRSLLASAHPDGIICANDKTAAELMHALHKLNVNVPKDIKVVGIDDVRYAKLLQPALTTVHQPCSSIGTVALKMMLERLADPSLPPRQTLLPVNLIVRESSLVTKIASASF